MIGGGRLAAISASSGQDASGTRPINKRFEWRGAQALGQLGGERPPRR